LFKIEKTEVQVSFDLTKRIDLRAAKKALENLILAGGFDSFGNVAVSIFHDDGITFMKRR
jgi:DNA polymerase-3 subunit alpha